MPKDAVFQVKVSVGDVKVADDDVFVVWGDACTRVSKPKPGVDLVETKFLYDPKVLVAQVGQKLVVRNSDKIQHNSFSLKAVAFDSGLQKPDSFYEVKLDKPGVTKVFCRIHPKMKADVLVLNNICYEKMVGGGSLASIQLNAAQDSKKIWLWGPRLKEFHSVELGKDQELEFKLSKADFLETVLAPPSSPSGDRDSGY